MNYKRDNNELLLFIIKQLIREQVSFERSRHGQDTDVSTISIPETDFIDKVSKFFKVISIIYF